MGAAGSTVYYNLRLRHPTLDLPIIDYDLALLFQPMLMLGISIGVAFNVIFPDWMVTVLLIILFLGKKINQILYGHHLHKRKFKHLDHLMFQTSHHMKSHICCFCFVKKIWLIGSYNNTKDLISFHLLACRSYDCTSTTTKSEFCCTS